MIGRPDRLFIQDQFQEEKSTESLGKIRMNSSHVEWIMSNFGKKVKENKENSIQNINCNQCLVVFTMMTIKMAFS